MFIGYSEDHAKEVYRMLNLSTNKVSTTRDIKWMKLTYKEYMDKIGEDNTTESSIKIIDNNQSEEELEIENVISHENESNQDESDEEKEDDSSSSGLDNLSQLVDTPINNRHRSLQRELRNLGVNVNLSPVLRRSSQINNEVNNVLDDEDSVISKMEYCEDVDDEAIEE